MYIYIYWLAILVNITVDTPWLCIHNKEDIMETNAASTANKTPENIASMYTTCELDNSLLNPCFAHI